MMIDKETAIRIIKETNRVLKKWKQQKVRFDNQEVKGLFLNWLSKSLRIGTSLRHWESRRLVSNYGKLRFIIDYNNENTPYITKISYITYDASNVLFNHLNEVFNNINYEDLKESDETDYINFDNIKNIRFNGEY